MPKYLLDGEEQEPTLQINLRTDGDGTVWMQGRKSGGHWKDLIGLTAEGEIDRSYGIPESLGLSLTEDGLVKGCWEEDEEQPQPEPEPTKNPTIKTGTQFRLRQPHGLPGVVVECSSDGRAWWSILQILDDGQFRKVGCVHHSLAGVVTEDGYIKEKT